VIFWSLPNMQKTDIGKSTYEVVSEGRRLADKLNTSLVCRGSGGAEFSPPPAELNIMGGSRAGMRCRRACGFRLRPFYAILFDIAMNRRPKIILFGASIRDKQLAARLAARLTQAWQWSAQS